MYCFAGGLTVALWTPSPSDVQGLGSLFIESYAYSRGLSGRPLDSFGDRLTSKALELLIPRGLTVVPQPQSSRLTAARFG